MPAHAIYLLDLKGRVIISRNYRGDIGSNVAQRFITRLLEEEEMNLKPIIEDDGVSFIYVRHNNLYRKNLSFALWNTIPKLYIYCSSCCC